MSKDNAQEPLITGISQEESDDFFEYDNEDCSEMFDTVNDEYEEYSSECRCALRIVNSKLLNFQETGSIGGQRPTFTIRSRLKTIESVFEKCGRKHYPLTIESIRENVQDVAGIRLITLFRDEIFAIVKIISMMPGITVIEQKDYITNPKPNGYTSYHMTVLVENFFEGHLVKTPVEIQIRSKAMDLWASIEHVIKYKNSDPSPEAEKIFVNLKSIVDAIDEHAIELRDFQSDELID